MRSKLFAANWKMNLLPDQAKQLIAELKDSLAASPIDSGREVMIAPPAILVPAVSEALAGSPIALGAQNMYHQDQGAFTGEISGPMLLAYGVRYVIIGHSERRHIFNESDDLINLKVRAALRNGLWPLLCVGETMAQRDGGLATEILVDQLSAGLDNLSAEEIARVTLAYEPVWAIGTGRNATPEQAQTEHGALRTALSDRAGHQVAYGVRILYGGSVNPDNVDSIVSKPDIDGALVGGASLKAESFLRIIRARI